MTRELGPVLKAAIFDLDGTLLDTESVARRAWEAIGLKWGVHIAPPMIREMTGKRYADLVGVIAKWYGPTFPSADFLEACNVEYKRECDAGIEMKAGVHDCLATLEGWGIPKVVATSSQLPRAKEKLADAGLLDRFVEVVSGDEVEVGKPGPEVFREAARRLGLDVDDENICAACVVFEDSWPGVLGAHRAGMKVVLVPDQVTPSEEMVEHASVVLDSLSLAGDWLAEAFTLPVTRMDVGR